MMLRNSVRTFSTSSTRFAATQAVKKKTTQTITPPFTKNEVEYQPQVFTEHATNNSTNRPLPVNVESIYWKAMRHEPTHKNLVCEIQLRSYDSEVVEFFGDFIIRSAYYLNIPVSGVIPLPKRRERWTVIKAPFVHAKTKENYQRITSKRLIRAYDANPEVIDLWVSFFNKHSIPGLGIKVQTHQTHGLDFLENLDTPEGEFKLEDTHASVSDEVKKKVKELLNDPVFKQHMSKATNENQIKNDSTEKVSKGEN